MVALASALTFQLGDTGVLLNDDSTPDTPFVDITKVSGLDNAPFRETKRDHEGVDGGFLDAEFETGRDIVLEGTIYSNNNDVEEYLDQLKANFAPSTFLVPFYFMPTVNTGTRLLFVKPLGVSYDWDQMRRLGCTAAQFRMYAEQPFIFDTNLTSVGMNVGATIFTGFGFPLGFPFSFGGASSTTDGQFLNNAGNRPTPITFTLTGPLTNPVLYNDTLNTNLAFNITLNSGETLTVDTYYRTVYFQGNSNRRSALTNAGWFYLDPGQNFIRFRAEAGTGTCTVNYRNAWR